MTNLLTQPYNRPADQSIDNYLVTLKHEFDLMKTIEEFGFAKEIDTREFLNKHPTGKARIWAVNNSAPALRAWKKLEVGDLVVFYGKTEIYAYGKIDCKIHWAGNNYIWPSGQTWDHIYSLSEFHEIPAGQRPRYQELRRIFSKLDVQSVGIRSLYEAGINEAALLQFILEEAEKSPKSKNATQEIHVPLRKIDIEPPYLGESFKDRKHIWQTFGGQWQQGINQFPNDKYVNVFSDESGPYPDYVDLEQGIIEYRGQGLRGSQTLQFGNGKLEQARLGKSPVRFWYKKDGQPWIFKTWALVSDRTPVHEKDTAGESVSRFIWFLVPVPSDDKSYWNSDIRNMPILDLSDGKDSVDLEIVDREYSPQEFAEKYASLTRESDLTQKLSYQSTPRRVYKRSREIRQIVLERAQFKCEFLECTGMPPDVKKSGLPILEVDHIEPLGEGGIDLPQNMVTLCPNCHEAKTHGKNKAIMIQKLKKIVLEKEKVLLSSINLIPK